VTNLIDVERARRLVLDSVPRPLEDEAVPLDQALGRVLAEDMRADGDLPPFDSSAMDGYAVLAGPGGELAVVGESRAGHPARQRLREGEAIAISTGAQIPPGAEAVVPVERTERPGDGGVTVPEVRAGANVRRAGEDVRRSELVLETGQPLGPAELAVAAAMGREALRCSAPPRVAVLVTGDELVEPGLPPGPGQIRDSNATALAAQAQLAGADVRHFPPVPDDREATVRALEDALASSDVVCISGGVSVGAHDHVKPALAELAVEERFWGVRLKPGKPTWFGAREGKLVFGLPGNPVSAMVTFQLFARPALSALRGGDPMATRVRGILEAPVERNPGREQAIRCRLRASDEGWRLTPAPDQGSHVLTSMVGAGALGLVEAGEGRVEAGQRVVAELLERP
jgi:molybdopterin molybdotransferase